MAATAEPLAKKQKTVDSPKNEQVLVIGANGYIGSAVVRGLKTAGWQHVVGMVRNSPQKVAAAREAGADDVIAVESFDTDVAAICAAVSNFRLCINTATSTDDHGRDAAVNKNILEALPTSTRPCVYHTSGNIVVGEQDLAAGGEDAPLTAPLPFGSWRVAVEAAVRDSCSESLRAVIVRPTMVYGGDSAQDYLSRPWFETAERTGSAEIFGDGTNCLPIVHVDDLAQLYALLLESNDAHGVHHALEPGGFVTTRHLAEACSAVAGNGSIKLIPISDIKSKFPHGFAEVFAMDQRMACVKSQQLGWLPRQFNAAAAYAEFKEKCRGGVQEIAQARSESSNN